MLDQVIFRSLEILVFSLPNGWRYPLVGGTRQRRFDGTNFKPRRLPENAQTPTTTVLVLSQGSGARCVSLLSFSEYRISTIDHKMKGFISIKAYG